LEVWGGVGGSLEVPSGPQDMVAHNSPKQRVVTENGDEMCRLVSMKGSCGIQWRVEYRTIQVSLNVMIRMKTLFAAGLAFVGLTFPSLAATPKIAPIAQVEATAAAAQSENASAEAESEAYKLALVYSVGTNHLYQKLQALLIQSEIERRQNAGISLESAKVSKMDVENRVESTVAEFLDKNPDLDFWVQVQVLGYSPDSYRNEVRRHLQLEHLFFPPNPEDWNMELLKGIFDGEEENSLWKTMLKETPAKLIEKREKGEPYQVDPLTMKLFLRPRVFKWLMDRATIEYPFDGLPDGVCLRVNNVEASTAELLESFSSMISDVDQERAAIWVELSANLEKDLAAKGVLITREKTKEIVDEEKVEYLNSWISYEQIALEFQGFPSMEMFMQFKRLRESFRETLPEPFSDETLNAHLDKRRGFIGQGSVKAEVILLSARDLDTGSWPAKGSFAAAKERAAAVVEALNGNPENWSKVLEQFSEYPVSTRGAAPEMPQPKRGRFGTLLRNPLRQFLGENDYTDFLFGNSIADDLFFNAEVGAIYGPRESAYGWYIYKLISRSEPTEQIDFKGNERHAVFVKDDYLTQEFLRYIAGVMSR
jgi:hypothetical protein